MDSFNKKESSSETQYGGYIEDELYQIWKRFRSDKQAAKLMGEFIGASKAVGQELCEKFKNRMIWEIEHGCYKSK